MGTHVDWASLGGLATIISLVIPFIVKYLVVPTVKSKMDDVEASLDAKFQKAVQDAVTPLNDRLGNLETRFDRHLDSGSHGP